MTSTRKRTITADIARQAAETAAAEAGFTRDSHEGKAKTPNAPREEAPQATSKAQIAPVPADRGQRATAWQPKRHRTGRNVHLGLKVTAQARADLETIAQTEGWGLGETLEHLLQRWHEK